MIGAFRPRLQHGALREHGVAADSDPRTFVRGDSNDDGVVDMSDPITTLGYLFLGGDVRDCRDALDADNSGNLSLSDPIFALSFLSCNPAGTSCAEDSL